MDIFYDPLSLSGLHFQRTIYSIFLAIVSLLLFLNPCFGQEIGAYKTRTSGDFNQSSTWEVWDGTAWLPGTQKPGKEQDIYIDQSHDIRLLGNEAAKSVFIHAGSGQKLNLNGNNLDVYGSLAAFTNAAPGRPNPGAGSSQNWIGNSSSSSLTFKGTSRVIVEKNSWSGETTRSRFAVIFDPGPGQVLTLMAPMKALSFRVRSGTLDQKRDRTSSSASCFTLSFNTENSVFGAGPFGDFTVESGATFRSECNANLINRSASGLSSALLFELQREGRLVLQGTRPTIEANQFRLDGTVIFEGTQGPISFLSSTYPNSSRPSELRHLELLGAHPLQLPVALSLKGDLLQQGSGTFKGKDTHLTLSGEEDQLLIGSNLDLNSLTVDKSGGTMHFQQDLVIERQFTLTKGALDFHGNALQLNKSGLGGYRYSKGSWRNLALLSYDGLPLLLDEHNATFPFEDLKNGGQRWLQFLGSPPAAGELRIEFVEEKGANHDANFQDVDGTTILYQLNSYFKISVDPVLGEGELELRMAADSLLIDKVEDLRLVKRGQAGPGTPLHGVTENFPWARRRVKWADLPGHEWTIGSFREATVLPLRTNITPNPRESSPFQNTDGIPRRYGKFKSLPLNILNCLPKDFRRFP
ncbi:MAG: hypothetical protein RJA23_748 [Bacteroidota bacterium]|jgi:hypothetical protein